MYIQNIARAIKKMTVNEIRDFVFENYYKQIGFSEENSYYSLKRLKYLFLLIEEGEKKHYVLINDFNRFMYDHSLHLGRKHFSRYCLHAFITEEILKHPIKDSFQINGKQNLMIMERKIQMNFILTNIKNLLPVVMVIKVLMINLESLLNHTSAKMLFTALLAV